MKYTFFKFLFHNLTIKTAVENATCSYCAWLALSLLMSLDDQINATEISKTELCASCVNSIADILTQRLVIQCHDNDTLPDLVNKLQRQS